MLCCLFLLGVVLAACSQSGGVEDASSAEPSTSVADEQSTDRDETTDSSETTDSNEAAESTTTTTVETTTTATTVPPIPWAELPPIDVWADPVPDGYDGRLLAYATVVDNGDGPMLCAISIDEQRLAGCDGLPILGLDWDQVDHEVQDGTRWRRLALLGQWDGTSFTLSDPPFEINRSLARTVEPAPAESPPCAEPAQGWWSDATDLTRVGPGDYNNAVDVVNPLRNFQSIDVYEPTEPRPAGVVVDHDYPGWVPGVLVVRLTESRDGLEAEIRNQWGGPLCLFVDSGLSRAGLRTTLDEVTARIDEVLPASNPWGGTIEGQVIEVYLPLATTEDQATVDDAFGPGIVSLRGVFWAID